MELERGAGIEGLYSLDSEASDLIGQIRDFQPDDLSSLKEKFRFFISLLEKEREEICNTDALDSLIEMLNGDLGANLDARLGRAGPGVLGDPEACEDFQNREDFEAINAYDLVGVSHDRVSIIDPSFRYVNTSQRNGTFYHLSPEAIIGKHVGELIGENRFEGRARRFLEQALSGKRQQYFHQLEVQGKNRIMSCEMMPLYTSAHEVAGTMVGMNDITALVSDPSSILLEEPRSH